MITKEEFDNISFKDNLYINVTDDGCYTLTETGKTIKAIALTWAPDATGKPGYIYFCWQKIMYNTTFGALFKEINKPLHYAITHNNEIFNFIKNLSKNWESDFVFFGLDNISFFHSIEKYSQTQAVIEHTPLCCLNPLCRDENKWAEPNLPNNFFMCYSCRDTRKWAFNLLQEKLPTLSSEEDRKTYIKSLFLKY